jgi:hypothetical protein
MSAMGISSSAFGALKGVFSGLVCTWQFLTVVGVVVVYKVLAPILKAVRRG